MATATSRPAARGEVRAWTTDDLVNEVSSQGSGFEQEEDEDDQLTESEGDGEDDTSVRSADHDYSDASEVNEADTPSTEPDFQDISFGALAKAQESLNPQTTNPRKRKHPSSDPDPSFSCSEPLSDLRSKLRKTTTSISHPSNPRSHHQRLPIEHRTSKHAPMQLSSRTAVSRKRSVFSPPPSLKSRDPRFDPTISSSTPHPSASSAANKNYAFLSDYREGEITALRTQIKAISTSNKPPPPGTPTLSTLKRNLDSLVSLQSRSQQQNLERDILHRHKQKEKQAIASGQKERAYFLKKSDLKKEVEKETLEGMGKRKREKREKRQRKRKEGREKKMIPWERRTA